MADTAAPEATTTSTAPEATVTATPGASVSDKHAEIRAKLTAAKAAEAEPATEPLTDEPAAAATTAPATPSVSDSVSAVMAMTAERDSARGEVKELRAQLAKLQGPGTIEELRARVRRDPGVLLDVFGEDIAPEADKRLDRFNEVALARDTDEWKTKRAEEDRISKLEADLEAERGARRSIEERERDIRARGHVENALTKGMKDGEATLVDPSKFPYVNHLAKSGELDVYEGIMLAVRELANDFRDKQKREPSEAEIGAFIANCAGKAEEHFAKVAKLYQLPAAPPPETAEPKRPRTIGASMGTGGVAPSQPKPVSRDEAHKAIRDRLRKATAQAPN